MEILILHTLAAPFIGLSLLSAPLQVKPLETHAHIVQTQELQGSSPILQAHETDTETLEPAFTNVQGNEADSFKLQPASVLPSGNVVLHHCFVQVPYRCN